MRTLDQIMTDADIDPASLDGDAVALIALVVDEADAAIKAATAFDAEVMSASMRYMEALMAAAGADRTALISAVDAAIASGSGSGA